MSMAITMAISKNNVRLSGVEALLNNKALRLRSE